MPEDEAAIQIEASKGGQSLRAVDEDDTFRSGAREEQAEQDVIDAIGYDPRLSDAENFNNSVQNAIDILGNKVRMTRIDPTKPWTHEAGFTLEDIVVDRDKVSVGNLRFAEEGDTDIKYVDVPEGMSQYDMLNRIGRFTGESAKAINFGLMYGMSAFGLSRQLSIPRRDAEQYIELYFARYPSVKDYMQSAVHQARESGFVETVFGRRLYLPDIDTKHYQRRQYAERSAINAPMQGTAADIIKKAMIDLQDQLENHAKEAKMVMQVHDELVLEVRENAVQKITALVSQVMSQAANLEVALKVDVGVGDTWDEAH